MTINKRKEPLSETKNKNDNEIYKCSCYEQGRKDERKKFMEFIDIKKFKEELMKDKRR